MAAVNTSGPSTRPLDRSLRQIRVAVREAIFRVNFSTSLPEGLYVNETVRAQDPDFPPTVFQFPPLVNFEGDSAYEGSVGSYAGEFNESSPPASVTHFDVWPFVKGKPGTQVITRVGSTNGVDIKGVEGGPYLFAWYDWVLSDPEDPGSEPVIRERQGRFKMAGTVKIDFLSGEHPDWKTYRARWRQTVSISASSWQAYDEDDDEWLAFFPGDYFEYRPSFSQDWVSRENTQDFLVTHAYALQYPGWFTQGPK